MRRPFVLAGRFAALITRNNLVDQSLCFRKRGVVRLAGGCSLSSIWMEGCTSMSTSTCPAAVLVFTFVEVNFVGVSCRRVIWTGPQ